MTEETLAAITSRCLSFILLCGDRRGIVEANLAAHIDAFRDLDAPDRFRVQVLLCQSPHLACTTEPADPLIATTSFRFYPRAHAPPEAVRTRE